jgi:hypothetical protein
MRMFKNKVLRTVFGTKRDEIAKTFRKFHGPSEELSNLY